MVWTFSLVFTQIFIFEELKLNRTVVSLRIYNKYHSLSYHLPSSAEPEGEKTYNCLNGNFDDSFLINLFSSNNKTVNKIIVETLILVLRTVNRNDSILDNG